MPPWRTVELTRAGSSPHSLQLIAMSSPADLRCCMSKSGGTYSASITGVMGRTLSRRTLPPEAPTSETAVSIAGLASSTSARSIGTRICLNMWRSPKCAPDKSPDYHGTNTGRGWAGRRLPAASIGRSRQRPGHDEALQAARPGMELGPVLDRKVDHDQPARSELLAAGAPA